VDLTAGVTYTILFYTDGNGFTMVDPEIDIRPLGEGELCQEAADVSAGPFPYQLLGEFDYDPPVAPTCDDTPNNSVWFAFTPTISAWYDITCTNATTTDAFSRLAVFFSGECDPLGAELTCDTANGTSITGSVFMVADNNYLILFYTDGEVWTMIDPEITITGI
jgi:hypothetical protein